MKSYIYYNACKINTKLIVIVGIPKRDNAMSEFITSGVDQNNSKFVYSIEL